jgi:hypothetical protein
VAAERLRCPRCGCRRILPYVRARCLDDEALRVMDIAYDNAQRLLYDLGEPVVVQEQ